MKLDILGKQIEIKKEVLIVGILILACLVALVGYILSKSYGAVIIATGSEQQKQGSSSVSTATNFPTNINYDTNRKADEYKSDKREGSNTKKPDTIKIYITGCVKKPGIITINKGDLIDDAIRAAGGVTSSADIENINLVFSLKENVMLTIYGKKETVISKNSQIKTSNKKSSQTTALQKTTDQNASPSSVGKAVKLTVDSGTSAQVVGSSTDAANSSGNSKVNLNTATLAELDKLPGIGEATATDIMEYRKSHGPFKSISDIMKVPRIKQSRFNSIKELITVEWCIW